MRCRMCIGGITECLLIPALGQSGCATSSTAASSVPYRAQGGMGARGVPSLCSSITSDQEAECSAGRFESVLFHCAAIPHLFCLLHSGGSRCRERLNAFCSALLPLGCCLHQQPSMLKSSLLPSVSCPWLEAGLWHLRRWQGMHRTTAQP